MVLHFQQVLCGSLFIGAAIALSEKLKVEKYCAFLYVSVHFCELLCIWCVSGTQARMHFGGGF